MNFQKYYNIIRSAETMQLKGRVTQVIGLVIEAQGSAVNVGELCYICPRYGTMIPAEVVGFRNNHILLMPVGGGSEGHWFRL